MPEKPSKERLDPAVLKLAAILVLGALAPLLDSTIVSIAIHTLGHDLHASTATVQWVSTGYLLALAMVVPVSGWAAERFGARRVWLGALVLFLAGSLLCGLSWNIESLVAFRVLQGLGGGLLLPVLQTLVIRAAGGQRLGRLMAVVSLPALVGPILGPVLGGLIISHLSWRWIFYVNLPVCLLAIALAWRGVPKDAGRATARLDLTGLLLVSPGLAALIYGLSEVGNQGGFGHARVLVPMAGGALLVVAFALRALRTAQPLVDLRLFRVRAFAVSSALTFTSGLTLFGGMFLLPLYYQQVRHESVIAAGLLLVPQGIGALLARTTGGLTDRLGPRPIAVTGLLLTALGTLPFAAHTHDDLFLSLALVVRGFGMSAANLALMVGAFQGLAPERVPHASATTRIVQQLGGSFGTAVLAVLLQRGGGTSTAFADTFLWTTLLTFLAVGVALLLPALQKEVSPVPAQVAAPEPRS
ncbi:DHA2 family efflux MFS transporter permease subunit [Streptomyces sp. NBC_00005]|uniref:DHA2 family efflux MFS transporter permease subunit n=1 Tax=Streptomyces sp. NBC_00005 TaxID=2903609 RepID=UPI00324EB88C